MFSLVCRLKYTYSCYSSNFCFLVIFVLLILVMFVLLLVAVVRLPLCFCIKTSNRFIDVSALFSLLARTLTPFLDIVSRRHLWDVRSYTSSWVFSVLGSIVASSALKWPRVFYERDNPGVYPSDEISATYFFFFFFSSSFLVLRAYSFVLFSFISAFLMVSASNIP